MISTTAPTGQLAMLFWYTMTVQSAVHSTAWWNSMAARRWLPWLKTTAFRHWKISRWKRLAGCISARGMMAVRIAPTSWATKCSTRRKTSRKSTPVIIVSHWMNCRKICTATAVQSLPRHPALVRQLPPQQRPQPPQQWLPQRLKMQLWATSRRMAARLR